MYFITTIIFPTHRQHRHPSSASTNHQQHELPSLNHHSARNNINQSYRFFHMQIPFPAAIRLIHHIRISTTKPCRRHLTQLRNQIRHYSYLQPSPKTTIRQMSLSTQHQSTEEAEEALPPPLTLLYKLGRLRAAEPSSSSSSPALSGSAAGPKPDAEMNGIVSLVRGDITRLKVDAVVNAANCEY